MYFSGEKCSRNKVQISKKSKHTSKCDHEFIVLLALNEEPPPQAVEPEEVVECTNYKSNFPPSSSSGGKCTECKNNVVYCSRACQVMLL